MVPAKLSLQNFMCYRNTSNTLDFEGIHVASLSGDNGAGKSALLDAMTWALWGQTRAKSDDELIHAGQTDMEVNFEFLVGQEKYRVIRKRSKAKLMSTGHTLLEFQKMDGQTTRSLSGNSIRETQRKINEVLRMDYQTFINSAFILQGRADEFTVKLPSERKKVLSEILGLSFYEELEQRAKDNVKERKLEVNQLEITLNEIEKEIKIKMDLEETHQQLDITLKSIDQEVSITELELKSLRALKYSYNLLMERQKDMSKHMEQSIRQIDVMNKRIKEHKSRIEKYQKVIKSYPDDINQIQNRLAELDRITVLLSGKRIKHQELTSSIHHIKNLNLQLKEEMNELKNKIELLKQEKAECPLCGTELGIESHNRIITNYQKHGSDKANNYRTNEVLIRDQEAESVILNNEIISLDNRIYSERLKDERKKAETEKDYIEASKNLSREQIDLNSIGEEIDQINLYTEENKKILNQLSIEMQTSINEAEKLKQVELKYNNLVNTKQEKRDKLVSVREKINRCIELEKVKLLKKEDLARLFEEKTIFEELAIAFGKKGIQALIIESAIPEIEIEADNLLAKMTDNRMHLKIESQRSKISKKDEIEETLDIKISDELGTRNYELFSGGEAFRINFAIRIALSRLLARRHGAPLPTLIIDEGFGTQDNAGKEKIIEAINTIQDDFEKIIVVTHIDELKEAFPVRIQVSKTVNGSIIEVN